MFEKIKKYDLQNLQNHSVPDLPGIYIFWNKQEYPIYIGKAKSLKNRISSYFQVKLELKTSRMVSEASKLSYVKVGSEIESLLLEARLINKYKPKYNILSKDDKKPNYIVLTNENYPRVLTLRSFKNEKEFKLILGPFPSSGNAKYILGLLRRAFPYSTHKLGKEPCLYNQINLCNPCPNLIEKTLDKKMKNELKEKYLENVRRIKLILSGRMKYLKSKLTLKMKKLSASEDFEGAQEIKKQIEVIDYITQPITPAADFEINPNLIEDIREKEITGLANIISRKLERPVKAVRIECFDVAHLSGTHPAASMVTFVNGEPEKKYYRHFKVNQPVGDDDISSMREIAERRAKHFDDWGRPDLIIVDGGKGQVGVFFAAMKFYKITVCGLEKQFETLVIPKDSHGLIKFREVTPKRGPARNLLQRIRDEAHRFARKYHHKMLSKSLFEEN